MDLVRLRSSDFGMKEIDSLAPSGGTALDRPDPEAAVLAATKAGRAPRRIGGLLFLTTLILFFLPILIALVKHVAGSELHSYILLIPFISVYLVYVQRTQLPKRPGCSPKPAMIAGAIGIAALAIGWLANVQSWVSWNDYLGLMTFSFLCLLVSGGFFFLGGQWMSAAAFPVAFLVFMIPMPDAMVDTLETGSKLASTEAATLFFYMSNTPFLRQGTVFTLPDISIQVAQECSGIRSSWILFITSLLGSYLFLRSSWRRVALVAFVIPLGILRNGFRILVIGLLCVHIGPGMIDSPIHHRGGPIFFVLSLVPLLLLLWWLRRGESSGQAEDERARERTGARKRHEAL